MFVAGALAGEEVRFMRRKRRRNFDEAELLEILEVSPERIDARCAAFGRCGGCALQHVTDEQQRAVKFQTLKDNLERIGHVSADNWLEPIAGPTWHYRRRARLAVKDVQAKGRVLVGFRERHAPFITDMHRCEVLARPVDDMLDPLSDLIGRLSIRARLPQVEVSVAENAIAFVFRVLDPPSAGDAALLHQFGEAHGIRVYLQPGGLDSIELLHPQEAQEALRYSLPDFDIRIEFDPLAFVQVNGEVNERMVRRAIELLDPGAKDRVLDLYCGIGNFSLPLARRALEVVAVEGDASLVARARKNASFNGVGNIVFHCADLFDSASNGLWQGQRYDAVLQRSPKSSRK